MLTLLSRPKPKGVLDWKARISIRALPSHDVNQDDRSGDTLEALNDRLKSLADDLCYACHTMLTSRSPRSSAPAEGVVLPLWVDKNSSSLFSQRETVVGDSIEGELTVTRALDRASMRDSIGEFLLDE